VVSYAAALDGSGAMLDSIPSRVLGGDFIGEADAERIAFLGNNDVRIILTFRDSWIIWP
jgi:hypothetical protein